MREHNWADNHSFTGHPIHRPATLTQAQELVAGSDRIRALGTRHSFNDIADSPGALIDLGGLPASVEIAADRRSVTVGGGTQYGVLAAALQAQGLALHNMASLPHISVAGAVATGTHGSGDALGNLSTAVAGLETIGADGALRTVRRGDPGFDGMVVGLGAFGVVTRVTLDVQPSFALRQDAVLDVAWDAVLADFDAVTGAAYSVSLMTMWGQRTVTRVWTKTRLEDGADAAPDLSRLGGVPAPPTGSNGLNDLAQRLNLFGVAGPWSERLPHFRADREPGQLDQIQSEYMVPRSQAPQAIALLRRMGDRIDPHLHITEIRTMRGDALWLSPAHGADAVGIHFTWQQHPEAVAALTREIEALLLPLGARPHWGKLIHAPAADLAPLYPRLGDFRALAARLDPGGKFRNAYMDRHVFGDA